MKIHMRDVKHMTRKTIVKRIIDFLVIPHGF